MRKITPEKQAAIDRKYPNNPDILDGSSYVAVEPRRIGVCEAFGYVKDITEPACHCGSAAKIAELTEERDRLKIQAALVREGAPFAPPGVLAPLWRMGWMNDPMPPKKTGQTNYEYWAMSHAAGTAAVKAEIDRKMKVPR